MKTIIIIDAKTPKKELDNLLKEISPSLADILPLSIDTKIHLYQNNFSNILSTNTFFKNKDHKFCLYFINKFRKLLRIKISELKTELNKYESFSIWFSNIIIFKYLNNTFFKFIVIRNLLRNQNYQKIIFVNLQNNELLNHISKINKNFTFINTEIKKEKIYKFEIKKLIKKVNNIFLKVYSFFENIDITDKVLISSINYNFLNLKTKKKIIYISEDNLNFLSLIKLKFKSNISVKFISVSSEKNKRNYFIEFFKDFYSENLKFKILIDFLLQNKNLIDDEVFKIEKKFFNFKKITNNKKPFMYISPFSLGISGIICDYLNSINVNSLCIPHGTCKSKPSNYFEYLYNREIAEGILINNFKYIAAQSSYSKKACDFYNYNSKKLLTGPICFLKKNDNNSLNHKNFLYASTFKSPNNFKFYGVETYDEYLETLFDLINFFSKSDYNLIIQPHPTLISNINFSSLRSYLNIKSENIIINKNSFQKNFEISNVIISYSSTVLEESLLSYKPIIIYDKWKRYNHFSDIYKNGKFDLNYYQDINNLDRDIKNIYLNSINYNGVDINLPNIKNKNLDEYFN